MATLAVHRTLASFFVAALAELMERIGLLGRVLGIVLLMTFSTGRRLSLLFLKLMVTLCAGNGVTGIRGMSLMVEQDTSPYGGEKYSDRLFGGHFC